jgi:hypothetical protein
MKESRDEAGSVSTDGVGREAWAGKVLTGALEAMRVDETDGARKAGGGVATIGAR